ncbi:MAG: hypothetical protein OXN17_23130 [Candidatus Poribacteria bacterium]|nr:hypothetical protein [Candidatus Poribacteria bacterium]
MAETQLNSATKQLERKVVFSEGFEADGSMTLMYANGSHKVNFVGVSRERAATGQHSFKVDVTWQDGTSMDWMSSPLVIPLYGNPVVRGKLYVERGAVRFGHAITVPEAGTKGSVVSGSKVRELQDGWTAWQSTSPGTPGDAAYIQAITVFTGPPDDEGRTVFYVDDLEIEAALPDNYEAALKARVEQIEAERITPLRSAIRTLGTRFAELAADIDAVQITFPSSASEEMRRYWQRLRRYRDGVRSQVETQLADLNHSPTATHVNSLRKLLGRLEKSHAAYESLPVYAEAYPSSPYIIWIIEPISNEKVLPSKFPVPGVVGGKLSISACPGEYEPASFAIHGFKALRDVTVQWGAATSGAFTLPSERIEVHLVKCWWQAGVGVADVNHPALTPELLLKDPDFVRVEDETKRNRLRDPEAPADADELRPISIPAGETQQFWVTVHLPEETAPGTYTGRLTLRIQNAPEMVMPFTVEVLPFILEQPAPRYSIYYRGRLAEDLKGSVGSKWKSPRQYSAEMNNLKAHGITHPTCHQDFDNPQLLDRVIELRKQAGIAVDPFYTLGLQTRGYTSPKELAALKEQVRSGLAQVRTHGIKELYIYGIDEASGEVLKSQRASFKATHEAGAKVFAACASGAFELVGDLLDLAVFNGPLNPSEARKWRRLEHSIFSYANPQVGVEEPETYRRNYGLALWEAGYDGAMNYAYQHNFGDIYADDDHETFRDHVFAYPTVDGVIDTIQWEGFREGVDDVRYLTTLLKAIENASGDKENLAREANEWVKAIDTDDDLQMIRAEMVKWILQLSR